MFPYYSLTSPFWQDVEAMSVDAARRHSELLQEVQDCRRASEHAESVPNLQTSVAGVAPGTVRGTSQAAGKGRSPARSI